jgi:hypothetical protein
LSCFEWLDFRPALKNGDSYGVNLGVRSIASVGLKSTDVACADHSALEKK